MFNSTLESLALSLVVAASTAMLAAEAAAADPKFDAKFKRADDQLKTTLTKEAVAFHITSPKGISEAEITLKEGDWPKSITLQLQMSAKGLLEAFSAGNGAVTLSGRLEKGGAKTVLQYNAQGKPITAGNAMYTMVIEDKPKDGVIEVTLPPGFCTKDTKTLKLTWIDAFRQ